MGVTLSLLWQPSFFFFFCFQKQRGKEEMPVASSGSLCGYQKLQATQNSTSKLNNIWKGKCMTFVTEKMMKVLAVGTGPLEPSLN